MTCLLHEKPFNGVNGSGKHVNFSLGNANQGNLLNPGATPHENMQFLVFCSAVIRAVHLHGDLLRAVVAASVNCQAGSPYRRPSSRATAAASATGSRNWPPRARRSATAACVGSGACPQNALVSAMLKSAYSCPSTSVNRDPRPSDTKRSGWS